MCIACVFCRSDDLRVLATCSHHAGPFNINKLMSNLTHGTGAIVLTKALDKVRIPLIVKDKLNISLAEVDIGVPVRKAAMPPACRLIPPTRQLPSGRTSLLCSRPCVCRNPTPAPAP